MNKISLGALALAAILVALFSWPLSASFNVLSLSHRWVMDRESFVIILAALVGLLRGWRWIPLVAVILGGFFVGPIATTVVAALIVYDRAQLNRSSWFSLKDHFFLIAAVLSCGLPEPLRSIISFAAVLGVSFDFELGTLGLLPAVLFAHTTKDLTVPNEVIFILVGIAMIAQLVWVLVNGTERSRGLWKNSLALFILSSSFLIKDHSFLPALLMVVCLDEILSHLKVEQAKQRVWIFGSVTFLIAGFPGFVSQEVSIALAQKEILWAIPFLPFLMMYFGLLFSGKENDTESDLYPLWSLPLVALLFLNAVWWSSALPPAVELGRFGLPGSVMGFLFQNSAEDAGSIDQNQLLISMGLVLIGVLLGAVLYRFLRPTNKIEKTEFSLRQLASAIHSGARRMGQLIPENHPWTSKRYHASKATVGDFSSALTAGVVLWIVVWVAIRLLKDGGLG